ncbi:hypothetical protein CWI39_0279p0030 [Hamiltosporidium magnivora]|uniref:Uncharacterized protein n=1 Tax=Hamiltosporidium magnivora TaxID=148818 RepID=A0A4Q9LJN5_9MICR|nr:hypothetical protein CWI39_0279p0030 [Hamiltosporidium magnivora]
MDTGIKTDVRIRCNRPDIYILDKRKNKQTLVEDRITFQDSLQTVETGKIRNYDLLANELESVIKCYLGTEMHKQPEHSLKKVDNKEDGGKTEIKENTRSLILDGIRKIMVGKKCGRIYLEKEKFVSPDFN